MLERRKATNQPARSSDLPADYLKMVLEVFTSNIAEGAKLVQEVSGKSVSFDVAGAIYPDEVLLAVSLVGEGEMVPTTVYASVDFDPKASHPTIEDLLGRCVDAAGTVFSEFLDPEHPERVKQLGESSLSAFENVPFEWTPVTIEKQKVHVRVDRTHLALDQMADDWLAKHDPDFLAQLEEDEHETEDLFVTGDNAKKGRFQS